MYENETRSEQARSTIESPYAPSERRVNTDPRERPQNRPRVSPWVIALGSVLIVCAALTACVTAAAGALQGILVATSPAHATVNRQFAVGALPSVQIDADAANIQVEQGSAGQVAVTLTKETHALTRSLAQQDLDAITLNTEQNGDRLTIRVNAPDGVGLYGVGRRSIRLLVTLPPTANVGVTSAAGNVEISDITGKVNVEVSAGNVTMSGMTLSGNSSVRESAGNIDIQGALAPETNLDLTSSAGNVDLTLPSDTRAHVEATTSFGNASVTGFPNAKGSQSTRNIISTDLNPNPESTITGHVSAGNLSIQAGA
jgi:hypothetical protein